MYDPYEERKDESYSKKDTSISLDNGIKKLLNAYRLNSKYNESLIKTDWEKLVGRTIALRTTNIYLNKTTLILTVNSSALKHELLNAKDRLIAHINKTFKKTIVEHLIVR